MNWRILAIYRPKRRKMLFWSVQKQKERKLQSCALKQCSRSLALSETKCNISSHWQTPVAIPHTDSLFKLVVGSELSKVPIAQVNWQVYVLIRCSFSCSAGLMQTAGSRSVLYKENVLSSAALAVL